MNKHVRLFLTELWLPVLLLGAWWFLSANSTSLYFPALSTITEAFAADWLFDHVGIDLVPSLGRLAVGYLAAVAIGVSLGLFLGLNRAAEEAVRPLLEFIRATPGIAILPVAMIFLGTGATMKIVMIAFVAFWPVLLNTIEGVRSVEPVLLDVSASYRFDTTTRLTHVVLPAAAPQIFAGARTAIAIGVVVMVVTEMVGTPGGLGYYILSSQRNFDLADMWAGIIVLGLVGYLINQLFRLFEGYVLRWHHGMVAHSKGGTS